MHEQQNSTDTTLRQAVSSTFGREKPSLNVEDMLGIASFKFFESANSNLIIANRL